MSMSILLLSRDLLNQNFSENNRQQSFFSFFLLFCKSFFFFLFILYAHVPYIKQIFYIDIENATFFPVIIFQ